MATELEDPFEDLADPFNDLAQPSQRTIASRREVMNDPDAPRDSVPFGQTHYVDSLLQSVKNSSVGRVLFGQKEQDEAMLSSLGIDPQDRTPNALRDRGLLSSAIAPYQGAIPRATRAGMMNLVPAAMALNPALAYLGPQVTSGLLPGALNAVSGLTESLASPAAAAALLPKTAARLVSGGFAADMLGHAPGQVSGAIEAGRSGDIEGATEAGLGAAGSLLFGGLAGAHAAGYPKVRPPKLPEEPPQLAPEIATKEVLARPAELGDVPMGPPVAVEAVKAPPAAPAPPSEPPPPTYPEMVGDSNPQFTTANKHAVIDAERAARGADPIVRQDGLTGSDAANMDLARSMVKSDPGLPQRLVGELLATPRVITPWEHLMLLDEKVFIRNAFMRASEAADGAKKVGDMDAEARFFEIAKQWGDKLSEVELATGKAGGAGSMAGASLRIRRFEMDQDFDLVKLQADFRQAHDNRAPDPAEMAKLKEVADAYKKASDAWEAAEANERGEAITRAFESAKADVQAQPLNIHPDILARAEAFVVKMEKASDAALERLKKKLSQAGSAPDPTIIADLVIMGSAKVARGIIESARWLKSMKDSLGDLYFAPGMEDMLKSVYETSKATVEKGLKTESEHVKRQVKKQDAYDRIQAAQDKISAAAEKDLPISSEVKKLFRAIIEADPGITRDAARDMVHDMLKESHPRITILETMDAISGRGEFSLPSQDMISKKVRDYKEQLRLVAHQTDVVAGRPLPRTGPQRDAMSDAARREKQKLNELMREHGVSSTNSKTQLAGALQARKTYYKHRISDLRDEIKARKKTVETKSPSPTDTELDALKAELEKVVAEHAEIFDKPGMTDAQRLKIAEAAAERSLKQWEQRLADAKKGQFWNPIKRRKYTNAEIEAINSKRDAARAEAEELKALSQPQMTPEQRREKALMARIQRKLANWNDAIARNDFTEKAKLPKLKLSNATIEAKRQAELVKIKYEEMKAKWKFDKLPLRKQAFAGVVGLVGLARDLQTGLDLPPVFRQGALLSLSQPIKGLRALGSALNSMRSPAVQYRIESEIKSNPNFELYKESGGFWSEHSGDTTKVEEAIRSNISKRVPVIGASQRGYTTFLNKLRFDTFNSMLNTFFKDRAPTPAEAKAMAQMINEFSGRGSALLGDKATEAMNKIFFAPRNLTSKFQVISGHQLYGPSGGSSRTRAIIASYYVRALTGASVLYGLYMLNPAVTVNFTDPTKSDFLKIKMGNRYLDPIGAIAQSIVFMKRLMPDWLGGQIKTTGKGRVQHLSGPKHKFTDDTNWRVLTDYGRTKLSPTFGTAINLWEGKDVVGNPVTPFSAALDLVTPMSWADIVKSAQEENVPMARLMELHSLFGAGLQSYDVDRKRDKEDVKERLGH